MYTPHNSPVRVRYGMSFMSSKSCFRSSCIVACTAMYQNSAVIGYFDIGKIRYKMWSESACQKVFLQCVVCNRLGWADSLASFNPLAVPRFGFLMTPEIIQKYFDDS